MTTLLWILTGASNAWFCWHIVGYLRKAPRYLANADDLVRWTDACVSQGIATPKHVRASRWTRWAFRALTALEVGCLGLCGSGVLYSAWRLLGGQ